MTHPMYSNIWLVLKKRKLTCSIDLAPNPISEKDLEKINRAVQNCAAMMRFRFIGMFFGIPLFGLLVRLPLHLPTLHLHGQTHYTRYSCGSTILKYSTDLLLFRLYELVSDWAVRSGECLCLPRLEYASSHADIV